MARVKQKVNTSIRYLTDEEFYAMKLGDNKSSFLDDLLDASKSSKGFTVKELKSNNEPKDRLTNQEPKDDGSLSFSSIDPDNSLTEIDDMEWDSMLDRFDEISPIDDISSEERYYYRRSNGDEDKFETMFKKERSMLNELLGDIQKRSKIVNSRIVSMGAGKGTYGISKNFIELIEASATLDNAKLNIIKELGNIKKTSQDMRLKELKMNPDIDGEEDRDSIADSFYKNIIGGNTRQFRDASIGSFSNVQSSGEYPSFNLTKPIPSDTDNEVNEEFANTYSYIANENRNVSINVYRYPDQSVMFVALDEEGNEVPDYELPDEDTLDSLDIKPLSKYAVDRYGRKYPIIDVDNRVDLDDIDDEYYDTVNDDDKYDD